MKHFPFLIFLLLLLSCKSEPHINQPADFPPVPRLTVQTLAQPTVTDTVRITKRVPVATGWLWQDDSTQERQIVQPDAIVSVVTNGVADSFPVNLSGTFGEWNISISGYLKKSGAIATPPDVTANEPEDSTSGGNDPPVVVPSGDFAIGSNTFPWIPIRLYTEIGMKHVRVYAPWHWFASPSPQGVALYSQPMKQAWTPECSGIKDYLTQCKAAGVKALFCFNQTPEWLRPTGNGTGGNDYPPIPEGRDRLNPDSYKEYSEFIFQIVATYGKTKHPASVMRVDQTQQYANQPVNEIQTGLGLMEEIEIGNEVDHWFSGFEHPKYMTAEEHAAMLSKCYDAAKRGDPNIRVVMAGLTDFNPWYLKRMNEWFVKNRPDKKFAADVINVHHYSNFKNKPNTLKPDWSNDGACYPEEDGNFAAIYEAFALAKAWGKDVYVTEFGADTKQPSQMYAAPRPGMTSEDVQAEIIVRTFKAYKAAGVKAAYVFTGPDDSSGSNTGQFRRCGIFTAKPEYKPKPAYQAIRKLISEQK